MCGRYADGVDLRMLIDAVAKLGLDSDGGAQSPVGALGGQHAVPCEKGASLPPLAFEINGKTFELSGEEYVLRMELFGETSCLLLKRARTRTRARA